MLPRPWLTLGRRHAVDPDGDRLINIRHRPVRAALIALAVVLVVTAGAFGWAALREPDFPDFTASGDPRDLPAEGTFPPLSLAEFEGVLVGQLGRPVVVNIWASWCVPCRIEMPVLQGAADKFAGQAVILGVASNDDPAEAQRFLKEIGMTYPNSFDESGDIRVALDLTSFPATYVFGADGVIRAEVNGGVSEEQLNALIEEALG